MNVRLAVAAVVLLYVLHQDFWFWHEARPLVLGFLPIGLFYHAAFTVVTSGVLWLLVTAAWPAHVEPPAGTTKTASTKVTAKITTKTRRHEGREGTP